MSTPKIIILKGDGIGPEVMAQTLRVLEFLKSHDNFECIVEEYLIGGSAFDAFGTPLPDETLEACKSAKAILLGAVGGPKWADVDYSLRPEAGLLKLRKELNLFANLRPAEIFEPLLDASSLKPEIVNGLNILIVRELTGGVYFGEPRGIFNEPNGERKGINTQSYTSSEILRVGKIAFEQARLRSKKLCSVDKANVMESGKLWREEISKLSAEYPDVELSHMYADNCAMQLLKNPKQFDVIVTDNLFGDILSDEASMLTGSLGLLPSASLSTPEKPVLYEPIHGSAPDIAGQNCANPAAMILSLGMAAEISLHKPEWNKKIKAAIQNTLAKNMRTKDIADKSSILLSTIEFTDEILKEMEK